MPLRHRLALAVGLLFSVPVSAEAWTEANVQSVQAHVQINRDGLAQVGMTLTVQVHGGWLEGLEIAGLDDGLIIDPSKPPSLVGEDGSKYDTAVRLRPGGRVFLTFPSRHHPRRGNYSLDLHYSADLDRTHFRPTDDGAVEIQWQLPGWRSGLDGVELSLSVPGEATPVTDASDPESIEFHSYVSSTQTTLVWRRVHLPLTVPWTIRARVASRVLAEALRAPPRIQRAAPPTPLRSSDPTRHAAVLIATLLGLLGLVKRWAFLREARWARVTKRPLLPMPEALRWLAIVASSVGAVLLTNPDSHVPALALLCTIPLLTIEWSSRLPSHTPMGGFHPASVAEIEQAQRKVRRRRWLGLALLDLRAPGGLCVAAILTGAVVGSAHVPAWHPFLLDSPLWFQSAPLLLAMFLITTRHQLPICPEEALTFLIRFQDRVEAEVTAVICADATGHLIDARLRFDLVPAIDGLLRCDIAVGQERSLAGYQPEPYLLVVSRSESKVEAHLRSRLSAVASYEGPGGRTARTWKASQDPQAEVDWLVAELDPSNVDATSEPPSPFKRSTQAGVHVVAAAI